MWVWFIQTSGPIAETELVMESALALVPAFENSGHAVEVGGYEQGT